MANSIFIAKCNELNANAQIYVNYINENKLLPTTEAAPTNNEGRDVIICDSNNFNRFKASKARIYKLSETGLTYEPKESYKAVGSGKKSVYFGRLQYASEAFNIEGWSSDEFTSLRKELGLPLPDGRVTEKNIPTSEDDFPEYVNTILEQCKKHCDKLKTIWEDLRGEEEAFSIVSNAIKEAFETQALEAAKYEFNKWKEANLRAAEEAKKKAAIEKAAKEAGVSVKAQTKIAAANAERDAARAELDAMKVELAAMRKRLGL